MINEEKIRTARKELGRFFAEKREAMGRTQEELALYVGISPNTLRGIEAGRFAWDIDMNHRLCAALEIKPYFHTPAPDGDLNSHLKAADDAERYYGFYISENIILHPGKLAILKLTYPRLFLLFNYDETVFVDYEDFKLNIALQEWLDPNDKPTDPDEIDAIITDCWNFLALTEQEEERLYNKNNPDDNL